VSHVRFGKTPDERVHSPLIPDGEADVVLAFEKLEALRSLDFLRARGSLIVNDAEIYPVPVAAGLDTYPPDILDYLRKNVPNLQICDAVGLATEAGNPRTANIVLLGILAHRLDLPQDRWLEVIKDHVPPKTIDVNVVAFHRGYDLP
jgi:indolepyruvate ferredoxin oxidoreductase beta subunit